MKICKTNLDWNEFLVTKLSIGIVENWSIGIGENRSIGISEKWPITLGLERWKMLSGRNFFFYTIPHVE